MKQECQRWLRGYVGIDVRGALCSGKISSFQTRHRPIRSLNLRKRKETNKIPETYFLAKPSPWNYATVFRRSVGLFLEHYSVPALSHRLSYNSLWYTRKHFHRRVHVTGAFLRWDFFLFFVCRHQWYHCCPAQVRQTPTLSVVPKALVALPPN